MTFTVAVIGRPNVGKSTLFNRLTGKQHAIVDDTPGVTRDRREGTGSISDMEFRLIDTAGIVTTLEKLVGDRAGTFSDLWRAKQLEYSFRRGLMQNYLQRSSTNNLPQTGWI